MKRAQLPGLIAASEKRVKELWAELCIPQHEQDAFIAKYKDEDEYSELKSLALKQLMEKLEAKEVSMRPLK